MHIQVLIHHYGYFGVFLILLLEMIGIPFPAETTLTLSGIEWTQGTFSIIPLLIAATVGNAIGSGIAYWIGRLLGRPVIVRWGKYVGITNERLDKANVTFQKYQTTVVLFSKFIAGIRVLVPYLAGINKMSFGLFTLYTTVSALVWSAVFIILGKYLGIEWSRYHQVLHQYLVPGIIVLAILVAVWYTRKVRAKKRSKTE
ncbi:DedA family protein [Alicyclobacillaceae bacterium I2511]|nr:DedA family protein [Alicyclobacillaceae bacterium I2511]